MKNEADLGDYIIVFFIAVVFIAGAVTVFRFMRKGRK